MQPRRILWDRQAADDLGNVIHYIRKASPQNAEKVKAHLLSKVKQLARHPQLHPPDKYKINNDGSFRAFEIFHLRISYLVTADAVRIVRVRHTHQSPKPF